MGRRRLRIGVLATTCFATHFGLSQVTGQQPRAADRTSALRGSYGTYDGEPRREDGHVDRAERAFRPALRPTPAPKLVGAR